MYSLYPAEDVLSDVQQPRGLRHPAAGDRPHLVEHIGVAVVQPHTRRVRHDALADGAKRVLGRRGKAAECTRRRREDELAEAHERRRLLRQLPIVQQLEQRGRRGCWRDRGVRVVVREQQALAVALGVKLGEQVAHLQRLSQVVVLVHVDRLQRLAKREDHGVVLVLGLALTDNDAARGVAVERQPHSVRLVHGRAVVQDVRREVQPLVVAVQPALDAHAELRGAVFGRDGDVQERRLEARVALQEDVDRLGQPAQPHVLADGARAVRLRSNDVLKLGRHDALHERLVIVV
eukprot:361465-Chlamydomonas_euryale.AAC.1